VPPEAIPAGPPRIAWLDAAVARLEANADIDGLSGPLGAIAGPFNQPSVAKALRGGWMGHALHPLLTDIPLGCWIAALALDMVGGSPGEAASRKLIGIGLAAVPLTAAAGLAEWDTIEGQGERRVTTVHALGNTLAAGAFGVSWLQRRRRRRRSGVAWALVGGATALVTGYLGGHLSFGRGVGIGHRGLPTASRS
jgi:uncharacterized membrane protein